jgi:hypothetical protein
VATPSDSVTLFVNYDGIRQIITGCRGTFSINCEVNSIPRISFSLTGIFSAPTDDALPTVTTSNQATPLIFKNGSTSNFAIFGFAAALQSWSLDFNNEVIYRELVGGTKEVLITDRRPSGTAVIENVALSSHNFFTDYTGTSTGTNTWLHGTTAGNKITVSCPQTDLGQPSYEESDGITMLSLPFYATPTSAGQNEFSLVYTLDYRYIIFMPFVIDQSPFYKWKVEVKVNKDGEVSTEIFNAHFKNISQSRFREMIKMVEDEQIDEVDVTKEVLVGWEDMEASDGSEVPFNKSTLNKLLEVRGFATAVGMTFIQSNEAIYKKN